MNSDDAHLLLPSPFFALPLEIRQCIYEYALDWPDLSHLFQTRFLDLNNPEDQNAVHLSPLCTIPRPRFQSISTPPILLVNRQLTVEALEILHRKAFVLTVPPPHVPQLANPEEITDFISESALQSLRFVVLEMSGNSKSWLRTVEMLLDIWCVQNCLQRVEAKLSFGVLSKGGGNLSTEAVHRRRVLGIVQRLRGFGEQVPVILEGYAEERLIKGDWL